jgi:hypothetical protein
MSYEPGHKPERTKLHKHPQVSQRSIVVVRKPWCFVCPDCPLEDGVPIYWWLRGAIVQPDGSLRCRKHSAVQWPEPSLEWCPACQRALPPSAFIVTRPDPEPGSREEALWEAFGLGNERKSDVCSDCHVPDPPFVLDRRRPCEQCGEKMIGRSDKRFCSSRCRVAAHRAARA